MVVAGIGGGTLNERINKNIVFCNFKQVHATASAFLLDHRNTRIVHSNWI